jgi:hypothetical protein
MMVRPTVERPELDKKGSLLSPNLGLSRPSPSDKGIVDRAR